MSSKAPTTKEQWNSRLGVVLAVAGSAVGFGNFLRFPGLAAQYGGGAFMIAYFCAFLLLGIPMCWVEWTLGRRGGALGGHSSVSIFLLLTRSHWWKYLGILGVLAPLSIAMYYMYLEGWTLGYAVNTAMGNLQLESSEDFGAFFVHFTGLEGDGSIFRAGGSPVIWFFLIALIINFILLYRGVSKGIEWFCKWSMPVLLITAIIVMVRVLTLGTPNAAAPENNVNEGLGYMWNPSKTLLVDEASGKTLAMVPANATPAQAVELRERTQAIHPNTPIASQHITLWRGLLNPELWLVAAGQIFFSLSVGFGVICTYSSYVRRKADIALSSLTANAANEVVEVGVAGMMIVPAAVSLLGVAAAAGASTFGLGFNVLPHVFANMPAGQIFGTLFFGLLFLAAVTSSLSLIQPAIAFLEEFWQLRRAQSVTMVIMMMSGGSFIVAWFTEDLLALDTLDFWLGNLSLYLIAALMLTLFVVKLGVNTSLEELRRGSSIPLPRALRYLYLFITPAILLTILGSWLYQNIFVAVSPQVQAVLDGKLGAILPLIWVGAVALFMLLVARSSRRYHQHELVEEQEQEERIPIS